MIPWRRWYLEPQVARRTAESTAASPTNTICVRREIRSSFTVSLRLCPALSIDRVASRSYQLPSPWVCTQIGLAQASSPSSWIART